MGNQKKNKVKSRDTAGNKRRRIKTEINKHQKKLDKLLRLHEEGRQRWTFDQKGNKTGLKVPKTQGIIPGSKRHEGLMAHIKDLKARV